MLHCCKVFSNLDIGDDPSGPDVISLFVACPVFVQPTPPTLTPSLPVQRRFCEDEENYNTCLPFPLTPPPPNQNSQPITSHADPSPCNENTFGQSFLTNFGVANQRHIRYIVHTRIFSSPSVGARVILPLSGRAPGLLQYMQTQARLGRCFFIYSSIS